MTSDTAFAREASTVLRRATNLAGAVLSGRRGRYYTAQARAYLDYTSATLARIKEWSEKALAAGTPSPSETASRKRLIPIAKKILGVLHVQIKNLLESDTLHIPFPLSGLLNDVARKLVPDAQIVLTSTVKLNWEHHPIRGMFNFTDTSLLAPLPPGLGVVSFPYSEASAGLTNALLFHELGHYVFMRQGADPNLYERFREGLRARPVGDLLSRKRAFNDIWGLVLSWSAELFCDLLASRITGPSFLVALTDLFSSLRSTSAEFFSERTRHPSDAFRLREIREFLRQQDTYSIVEADLPELHARLVAIEAAAPAGNLWIAPTLGEAPGIGEHVVASFIDDVCPVVRGLVSSLPAAVTFNRTRYQEQKSAIWEFLRQGIVPSAASVDPTSVQSRADADDVVLFMACQVFAARGYPNWRELFGGKPEDLSTFPERLDELLLKSVDDSRFIRDLGV